MGRLRAICEGRLLSWRFPIHPRESRNGFPLGLVPATTPACRGKTGVPATFVPFLKIFLAKRFEPVISRGSLWQGSLVECCEIVQTKHHDATPLKTVPLLWIPPMPLIPAARLPCENDFGGFSVSNRENFLSKSLVTSPAPVNFPEDATVVFRRPVNLRTSWRMSRPLGRMLNF